MVALPDESFITQGNVVLKTLPDLFHHIWVIQ